MKYYDKEGNEISKSSFYRKLSQPKKTDFPLYYSEDRSNGSKFVGHLGSILGRKVTEVFVAKKEKSLMH